MKTFATLMKNHLKAEIVCPFKGTVVRRLIVMPGAPVDMIRVDAITEHVDVPLSTPITYQPWVFDRGSLLFDAPNMEGGAKLCTESDKIRYADGTEEWVTP